MAKYPPKTFEQQRDQLRWYLANATTRAAANLLKVAQTPEEKAIAARDYEAVQIAAKTCKRAD